MGKEGSQNIKKLTYNMMIVERTRVQSISNNTFAFLVFFHNIPSLVSFFPSMSCTHSVAHYPSQRWRYFFDYYYYYYILYFHFFYDPSSLIASGHWRRRKNDRNGFPFFKASVSAVCLCVCAHKDTPTLRPLVTQPSEQQRQLDGSSRTVHIVGIPFSMIGWVSWIS